MYQDHQGLPRKLYKEQCHEEGADERSVGRIIPLSGPQENITDSNYWIF